MIFKNKTFRLSFFMILLVLLSFSVYANSCTNFLVDGIGASSITSNTATVSINAINDTGFTGFVGVRYREQGTSTWTYATTQTFDPLTAVYNFNLDTLTSLITYEYQGYVIATSNECSVFDLSPETFTTLKYDISVGTFSTMGNIANTYDDDYSTAGTASSFSDTITLTAYFGEGVTLSNITIDGVINNADTNSEKLYVKYLGDSTYTLIGDFNFNTTRANRSLTVDDTITSYYLRFDREEVTGTTNFALYEIDEGLIPLQPTINLSQVNQVYFNGADIDFDLVSLGGYSSVTTGINYSVFGSSTYNDTCETTQTTAGTKNCLISGLADDTLYTYNAYVEYEESGTQRIQTADSTFLTGDNNPSLFNNNAEDQTYNSAKVNGIVLSSGNNENLSCNFVIYDVALGTDFETDNPTLINWNDDFPFYVSTIITGLKQNYTYNFELQCRNLDASTVFYPFNALGTIETLVQPETETPIFTDSVVSSIAGTSAKISTGLTSNFTVPSSVHYIYNVLGSSVETQTSGEFYNSLSEIPSTFSETLSGLNANTTYEAYFVVYYGANYTLEQFGTKVNFTTLEAANDTTTTNTTTDATSSQAKATAQKVLSNIFIIIGLAMIIGVCVWLSVEKVKHPMVYFIACFIMIIICNIIGFFPFILSVFLTIGLALIALVVGLTFRNSN